MLRACALLGLVLPQGEAAAQRLAVGRRDTCLLDLHESLFGSQLEATATCERCGERLELRLNIADLRVHGPEASDAFVDLEWRDYRVRCRLPDSLDLAAVAPAADLRQARDGLTARCVSEASRHGVAIEPGELPDELLDCLSEALSDADPQATTELVLCCPACDHRWSEPFDIAAYLLEGLGQWAERCLDQVHVLARAYGWSEAQVLSLSPARRARYIARVMA
jgi:hypothetical protein